MPKFDPDAVIIPSEPVQTKVIVPEVREEYAVMYPYFDNRNVILDELSKCRVWEWDIKQISQVNQENFGRINLFSKFKTSEELNEFKRENSLTVGQFITVNAALISGFIFLRRTIVKTRRGGKNSLGENKSVNDLLGTSLFQHFKNFIGSKK